MSSISGVRYIVPKSVELQAIQWNGKNLMEVRQFTGRYESSRGQLFVFGAHTGLDTPYAGASLYDSDLNARMPVDIGEWIIKENDDTFHVMPEDVFEDIYRFNRVG